MQCQGHHKQLTQFFLYNIIHKEKVKRTKNVPKKSENSMFSRVIGGGIMFSSPSIHPPRIHQVKPMKQAEFL